MKNLIRTIIKEEINDFDWVEEIPEGIDHTLYIYMEEHMKVNEVGVVDIRFHNLTWNDVENDIVGWNVMLDKQKKWIERRLKWDLKDIFPDIEEGTLIRTIRKFLNDKFYGKQRK